MFIECTANRSNLKILISIHIENDGRKLAYTAEIVRLTSVNAN